MDLWKRSQDRTNFCNVDDIFLNGNENNVIDSKRGQMAKYKTEKRALEVLDEIDESMSNAVNNGLNVAHYTMPEK